MGKLETCSNVYGLEGRKEAGRKKEKGKVCLEVNKTKTTSNSK